MLLAASLSDWISISFSGKISFSIYKIRWWLAVFPKMRHHDFCSSKIAWARNQSVTPSQFTRKMAHLFWAARFIYFFAEPTWQNSILFVESLVAKKYVKLLENHFAVKSAFSILRTSLVIWPIKLWSDFPWFSPALKGSYHVLKV